jgi:hypothetical protein
LNVFQLVPFVDLLLLTRTIPVPRLQLAAIRTISRTAAHHPGPAQRRTRTIAHEMRGAVANATLPGWPLASMAHAPA